MFKHVLLFKFIDPEVCAPVVGQKLLALKETVPEIVKIESQYLSGLSDEAARLESMISEDEYDGDADDNQ